METITLTNRWEFG